MEDDATPGRDSPPGDGAHGTHMTQGIRMQHSRHSSGGAAG